MFDFLTRASWNDQYIATTTPGQIYSGKFAGKKGQHFKTFQVAHRCLEHTVGDGLHRHGMFRDEANRILFGNLRDLAAESIEIDCPHRRQRGTDSFRIGQSGSDPGPIGWPKSAFKFP